MATVLRGAPARALALATVFASSASLAGAQAVPNPSATPTSPAAAPKTADPESPVVELSPFEVRADNDVGYQAGNTTSGSRLNSRLKEPRASGSPFTPEFVADIAASNIQEMLGHANHGEVEFEDSQTE